MSDLRLEDLRVMVRFEGHDMPVPALVTASEVASVLSGDDLLRELVRRGVLTWRGWQLVTPVQPNFTGESE